MSIISMRKTLGAIADHFDQIKQEATAIRQALSHEMVVQFDLPVEPDDDTPAVLAELRQSYVETGIKILQAHLQAQLRSLEEHVFDLNNENYNREA